MSVPGPVPAIDGYEVLQAIGAGGSAKVYLARQLNLDRDVALKVLPRGVISEGDRRQFETEKQLLAKLEHPNIVAVYDGGFTLAGEAFIVMQLCRGGSVQELLETTGTLDAAQAVRVALRVAMALEYAHRSLVIHQDVKPANVLLTVRGEPVLADFGIGSSLDHDAIGRVHGYTLHYAAPEVLVADPRPSSASDLYSLGSTLFAALVGHPPHQRQVQEQASNHELQSRVLNEPSIELPGSIQVPRALRALVKSLLLKDVRRRPDHAGDVVAALQGIEQELRTATVPFLLVPQVRPDLRSSERPISASPSRGDAVSGPDLGASGSAPSLIDLRDPDDDRTVHAQSWEEHRRSARFRDEERTAADRVQSSLEPSLQRSGEQPTAIETDRRRRRVPLVAAVAGLLSIGLVVMITHSLQGDDPVDIRDGTAVLITRPAPVPLQQPTVVQVRVLEAGRVSIEWDAPQAQADVEVEVTVAGELQGEPHPALAGATSLVIDGLDPTSEPCFTVAARDKSTDRVERSAAMCRSMRPDVSAAPDQ